MFDFLWNKAKNKEINQLIYDAAEYKRISDQKELFRRMKTLELYTPVISNNFNIEGIENGKKLCIEKGMQLSIPSVSIGNSRVARFFVNKSDSRLTEHFVGLTCIEVFNMVEKSDDVDGFVFYNDKESYFGVPKFSFPSIRKEYSLY